MRLDQPKHGLHGDQCIGCSAPGSEHIGTRLNGMRIGSGHHPVFSFDRRARRLGLKGGGHRRTDRLECTFGGGLGRHGIRSLLS